jgi:hypothetical protein
MRQAGALILRMGRFFSAEGGARTDFHEGGFFPLFWDFVATRRRSQRFGTSTDTDIAGMTYENALVAFASTGSPATGDADRPVSA